MPAARVPVAKSVKATLLGEPLKFATSNVQARNRLLKAAMSERLATYVHGSPKLTGVPTERLINVYDKFGHGGFGVICTGNIMVSPNHLELAGNVVIAKEIDSPERRDKLSLLTKAAKADGALVIAQLSHSGAHTPVFINPQPFSASDVEANKNLGRFGKPVPLTLEQIKTEVTDRFVYAAKYCKEAGFDGVEVHASYLYLLAQFLSPTSNKRTDAYGGSAENRVRILLEIYEGIRQEIPASTGFIVGVKINSTEFQGGFDCDDAGYTAEALDNAGFDFVELTGGSYEKPSLEEKEIRESTKKREEFFTSFYQQIKPKIKNAKVYLTGGFRTVPGMVAALENGDTDGIGLARPSTAEPDIAKKIVSGKAQSVANNLLESDIVTSIMASATQLGQAGLTSMCRVANNDPTYGIMDTSDESVAERYKQVLGAYFQKVGELTAQGKPVVGTIEFDPKQKPVKVSA